MKISKISILSKYFKLSLIILIATIVSGCAPILTPIVKPLKYYEPRDYSVLVESIPSNSIYIGTAKIVPSDNTFIIAKDKDYVINRLLKEAAKAGADFVLIKSADKNNKDYLLDIDQSDGYTIVGEMFRSK